MGKHLLQNTVIYKSNYELYVNALSGLLLISTEFQFKCEAVRYMCQCPQRASTHFYVEIEPELKCWKMCQCPQRASTHFYGSLLKPLILLASERRFCK